MRRKDKTGYLCSVLSSEFEYNLKEEKIASHPVSPRRSAKLLRVPLCGELEHGTFEDLPSYLKDLKCDSLWVNDTKVIQSRLYLVRPFGGRLEIFLLEPLVGVTEIALSNRTTSSWKCMIRRVMKWKSETASLNLDGLSLTVTPTDKIAGLIRNEGGTYDLTFNWTGAPSFGDVLDILGKMPLPPYMQRESDSSDSIEYQTVFARLPGSVAAPTAGLHYDDTLLEKLTEQGLPISRLTLHVGAGTFRPLSEGSLSDHTMHAERCLITRDTLNHLASTTRRVATGTTSLRTLESLFWMAVVHHETGEFPQVLGQWTPYNNEKSACRATPFDSYEDAMHYLLKHAPLNPTWDFRTQIMIRPGYKVRSIIALVTNFHQPGSTLLCLIAACMATPWENVYTTALQANYRFLSYGDGCLIEL
ncbi:MAG TPA: S-adenosylmethionine:tRNA ribosyltransferase-isomerase [Flavobacteriales bacterium]|nr:S-adenosylmethionine:tRNA ribosyltransferase-isomerase [Flavobacteriales bacterium]HIO16473.1 S-adenosylmethionine:tRNA ribosyltransferase-isomerase [Flavobacteriales bacterium]